MKKSAIVSVIIQLALVAIVLTGEIKCIIKAVNCNWNPIGKAEVVYTAASCTGLGAIVGYFDIEDN